MESSAAEQALLKKVLSQLREMGTTVAPQLMFSIGLCLERDLLQRRPLCTAYSPNRNKVANVRALLGVASVQARGPSVEEIEQLEREIAVLEAEVS